MAEMMDMLASNLGGSWGPVILGLIGGFILVFVILALAVYIYSSLALMAIAKRTKYEPAWLAWIPLLNTYLVVKMSGLPWWTFFGIFLPAVPSIGGVALMALTVLWWWKIAEKRKMEGWLGILMIIPIANLVVMGVLAWSKK